MAFLPDAGIDTIEDKLKTVLKLRSATVNDYPPAPEPPTINVVVEREDDDTFCGVKIPRWR